MVAYRFTPGHALGVALLSTTLLTALHATPAVAQAERNTSRAESSVFEEVVVTARRKEENLQDVSLAVTALSQDELQTRGITTVTDLQYTVPSMTLYGPYRDSPILSIRGQGGYTPGGSPSVVMYLNEVPMPTSVQAGSAGGVLGGPGLFYDLENIQVLKGPQGTLFGRNTTGGAILVQTRRPDDTLSGNLQITAGNYDNRGIQGALNLPVIEDRLLVRLAVNSQKRDGFTKTAGTPSKPGGKRLDDIDFFSGRLSATLRLGDAFENETIIDYLDADTQGTSSILRHVNPGLALGPGLTLGQLAPGLEDLYQQQQQLGNRRQLPLSVDTRSSIDRTNITNITRYELSEQLTLRNILSYTKAEYFQTIDADGTPLPLFDPVAEVMSPYVTRQYTEEIQLQGSHGLMDWTAGLFFLESPVRDHYPMQRNTAIFQDTYVGTREGERSKAIYAQSDFNLDQWVDGLKLIAGVRYTEDTIIRKNRDLLADGSCTADFADAYCVTKDDGKFRAFTGVLGVDYQLTADTLIYLTSRRGFRSGGFNITGALPNEQSYDPEYVIDLEAGIKSTLALGGAQLRWDAALYQQRYTDIQLPRFYADAHGRPVPVIENTGKARITGFELQSDLRLTSNLSLGMHFSWIDYDFTHLSSGVEKPIVTNIPKYKYGLNANYYLPVDPAHGEIRLSANWNWQDDSYISATDDPYALQKSYGLLNLDATWSRIAGQPVDVSLFMTNVNNKNYAIGGLPMSNLLGTSTLTYGEPRMWGVRIQYHFDP